MTNLLYELFYVLSVSAGLLSVLSDTFGIGETSFIIVIIQMIITALFVMFKRVNWTIRIIMLSVIITLIIAGLLLANNDAVRGLINDNISYLWMFVIGLTAFIIGEAMSVSLILKGAISIIATASLIIGTIADHPFNKLFVCATFLLILMTIAEIIQIRWDKQGHTERRGHVVFASPFILATIIIVLISPAPETPYDWGFAKKAYEITAGIFDYIIDALTFDKESMDESDPVEATMGFSEKGSIAGNLTKNDKAVMEVSGLSSSLGQIRLIGKTFNTFNGKEWTDTDTSEEKDTLMDTISMWSSLDKYTDMEGDFARRTSINIKDQSVNTDHIFVPLKSIQVYNDPYQIEYNDHGGDIIRTDDTENNEPYSVSYYLINLSNPVFYNYLKNATVPTEKDYTSTAHRLTANNIKGCTYQDYLSHADHIKNTYTEAPTLSPKLRKYIDEICKGATSDIEKLDKIRDLLRSYKYNLSPGALPDNIDSPEKFLDYFILEKKEGFCVHFATAFTLLARAEGIPTRYVQGYLIKTKKKSTVEVYGSAAHAWPEVYIDGAGWIPYEPTPAYETNDSCWKTADEIKQGVSVDQDAIAPHATGAPINDTPTDSEENTDNSGISWYMIIMPVGIGILFIILSLIIGKLIAVLRFKKKSNADKLIILCRQSIRILRLSGLPMLENETLSEYRHRLTENGVPDLEFLNECEHYLYKNELSDMAVPTAFQSKKRLLLFLKKKSRLKLIRYYLGFR